MAVQAIQPRGRARTAAEVLRGAIVAALERPEDGVVRWQALGALFFAGGTLALLSMLVSDRHDGEAWIVFAVGVSAVVTGSGLIAGARRLPGRFVGWFLALGTSLISTIILAGGRHGDIYAFIYVWVAIDSFYFLSHRQALAQFGWLTTAAGAVTLSGSLSPAQLLMVVGTCGVGAALVGVLQSHIRLLIAQLAHAAKTDWLTGVMNRRGLQDALEAELARTARRPAPVTLLIIDLDNFKLLNDEHGHGAGDEALRSIGAILKATKRETDAVGRLGGEEFALLLPDTDQHGGYLLAERLRAAVQTDRVLAATETTISIGVATHPHHATGAGDLLRAADQAMYAAKHLGRNRTVLFSSTLGDRGREPGHETDAAPQHLAAVLVLAEALDLRDGDTASHARTVGRYAAMIARELGLESSHIERIRAAGHLHDVGKIGVPDPILRKPGPLTDAEWIEMRKHSELGARIVASANLPDISHWVLAHHERPDGTGYPQGLTADEIPLEALILSVADSYEAMTADRVYRAGLGHEVAREELLRGAGAQFDARVVEALLRGLAADPGARGPASATEKPAARGA
jgi:diguanylate cyclase (GGDEF)-like protein/putative nucleotidyltransferase with HDIG domain